MRVSTGIYKGRALERPKKIRPTQNKVRKAIFDVLGDIEGLSFLELFAGSGAVGFEAASRGAGEVMMVELNRDCIKAIHQNIESLKARSCTIYPAEAESAVKLLHKKGRKFDIIFLDPPYYGELSKKTLQMLEAYDIVAPAGLVVCQHFKKDPLPEALGDLTLLRQKAYGDTLLTFYRNS